MASSALSRKHGSVGICRSDTLSDLLAESSSSWSRRPMRHKCNSANNNNRNDQMKNRRHLDCALDLQLPDTSYRNWLSPKSVKQIQITSNPDGREMDCMCSGILQAEEQYTREVHDFLCHCDVIDLRRRELLYQKWTNRVFEPIQNQVVNQTRGPYFARLLLHKRHLYNEYLEACNTKDRVLLESTDAELCGLRPVLLTAQTGPLNDPLLSQGRCQTAEDSTIYSCMTGVRLSRAQVEQLRLPELPLRPTGRHGTTWRNYQLMDVNYIDSATRQAERKKMNPNKTKSNLTWAHYYVPCSKEIVDGEIGVAGKRHVGPVRRVDREQPEGQTSCARSGVTSVSTSCDASATKNCDRLEDASENGNGTTTAAEPSTQPQCL